MRTSVSSACPSNGDGGLLAALPRARLVTATGVQARA
jgi:hypothetical protein